MKKILFILAVSCITLGFTSCKKCVTCQIKNINGTVEAEYEEYCGTPKEIESFKDDLKKKTQTQMGQTGQVICTDSK